MTEAARRNGKRARALALVSVSADVLAVLGGYVLAARIRTPLPGYRPILLGTLAFWPAVFAFGGLYDHRRLTAGWQELRRIFAGVNLSMFVVILTSFLADQRDLSRGWTIAAWPSCLLTVTAARLLVRKAIHVLRSRGRLRARLAIVGTNEEARSIARSLLRNPWIGYKPVGFIRISNGNGGNGNGHSDYGAELSGEGEEEEIDGIPVIGWTKRISEAVRGADAAAVLVASTAVPSDKLAAVYRDLQEQDVEVRITAGILNIAASRMAVEPLDGLPVLALRQMQLPRSQAILKRCFDIVGSSLLLLLLAPAFLVIATLVRLSSPGPVLFRQERVGLKTRPFTMLKFRTMWVDAEQREEVSGRNEADGLLFKMRDDPRVTAIGRVLRRWALDEMPQLVNVLRGEMSLVGPRPPLPGEVAQYDGWLRGRLKAKPGMTGLWQVNGRHELGFADYVRYDLFYVQNWSVALDLSILWRTIPAVLSRRGSW